LVDDLLNHAWKMSVFEGLDLFGKRFRGIVGIDRHSYLEDGLPVVIVFIDIMDGDPALFIFCRDDGFMDMSSIHSFSAVARQERGVDVDNPVPVGLHQFWRDLPQKSRQHDEIDFPGLQFRDIGRTAEELLFFDQQDGDIRGVGNIQYARVGVITDDKPDRDSGVVPEVFDDPGSVGTSSRRKNSEFFHGPKTTAAGVNMGLNFACQVNDNPMTEGQRDLSQIAETHAQ
jgi:hypothetical protein